MKKYFIKGTNSEVKLGNEFVTIIKTEDGKKWQSNSVVDKGTIEDLLKRNALDVKDVPVEKKKKKNNFKIYSKKINGMNVKIINVDDNSDMNIIAKTILKTLLDDTKQKD